MRIYFIHDLNSFNTLDGMCRLLKINKLQYNLVWDNQNPEILIVSERIYMNEKCFNEFLRLKEKCKIIVLFLGEAIEPDFNIADYCVGFSLLQYKDRYVHLPSAFTFFKNSFYLTETNNHQIPKKTEFCNFIYSNGLAHPRRDQLFHLINSYKNVDSLGKHLRNKTIADIGYKGVVGMKSPYKFSIASENATFEGYTSEKIWTSLCAHSVPIYFGNPLIDLEINPKCFINANNMSDTELLEVVKKIDNDNDLYNSMLQEPWQTD